MRFVKFKTFFFIIDKIRLLTYILQFQIIEIELDPKKETPNCAVNYFFDQEEARKNFSSNFYDLKVSNILKIN